MEMYQSEKNFLERLADAIPGLKGYRDKEARRDTDKRLREYMADRLDRMRRKLEEVKRNLVSGGQITELDDIERVSGQLFKAANLIRHANYGYSGFFDQVKIQETELDRIYQYDLALLTEIDALEQGMKVDPTRTITEMRKDWEDKVAELTRKIEDRKNLFTALG